jgi:putative transposase
MHANNCVTEEDLKTLPALTDEGVAFVLAVSQADPARKVAHSAERNVTGESPLIENGVALQFESESGEFRFMTELKLRRDLWGVYDQPKTIHLLITDKGGFSRRVDYTADFLVVDALGVTAYEIKKDKELKRLCRERPTDWFRDESGYHYGTAEIFFSRLGIAHRTIANSELSSVLCANIDLICSSRTVRGTLALSRQKRKAELIVQTEGFVRASELLQHLGTQDATPVIQLIDEGRIFASLRKVLLTDLDSVFLANSQEQADAQQAAHSRLAEVLRERRELEWDELPDGNYIGEIAARLEIVEGRSRANPRHPERELSERQIQRLIRTYRESGGDPMALTPGWGRCGSRGSKLSSAHSTLLIQCIRAGRSDPDLPTVEKCYDRYKEDFEDLQRKSGDYSDKCVHKSTFYRWWNTIQGHEVDARGRGGRRLYNAECPVYDSQNRVTYATRPFAIAHIDHWLADFFLVVSVHEGERITARPWVTAMIDGCTDEILALWMSFDAPSRKSNSMVIRHCVLRHGRLPEIIMTDGGPDFRSTHFTVMLACYNVTHMERPPEDPGFGQPIESLFARLKASFAKGLPGYGLSIEQARAVSGSFKSERRATLTLEDATDLLELFAYGVYNLTPRAKDIGTTRLDLRKKGLAMFPFSGRIIAFDLRFAIATSIDAAISDYKLYPTRGVHVNNVWFTHPALRQFRGWKKDVHLRVEPYDQTIVYIALDHRWFICHSSDTVFNASKSDRSLLQAANRQMEMRTLKQKLKREQSASVAKRVLWKVREIIERQRSLDEPSFADDTEASMNGHPFRHAEGGPTRLHEIPYEQVPLFD